jgi:hypothetical protein
MFVTSRGRRFQPIRLFRPPTIVASAR